jgi:murein L,D-transpeptidase YafK
MRNKKATGFTIAVAWIAVCLLAGSFSPASAVAPWTEQQKQSLIPEALINLSSNYAVVVDKQMQRLYAFRQNHEGMEKVFEAPCSTGKNSGPKMISGDGKTPEGILFATRIYRDKDLSSTYGCLAFHLNYPNLMDRLEGKDGNNIWIHGTDKKLCAFQTNGCVALTNKNILDLSSFIKLEETPIIIKNSITWVPEATLRPIKTELESVMNLWWEALRSGDLQKINLFYDSEESRDRFSLEALSDKMASWKRMDIPVSSFAENISILHHDRYTVITFDQVIAYKDQSWKCGSRKLFLKKNNDRWSITGERVPLASTGAQFAARLNEIGNAIATRTDIEGMIAQWVKSWQSGDIETYRSHYSPDFRGYGMNLSQWLHYKAGLIAVNKNIRITIENLKVIPGTATAMVIFTQRYESTGHSDFGTKKLRLKRINNRWKIVRESWKAL